MDVLRGSQEGLSGGGNATQFPGGGGNRGRRGCGLGVYLKGRGKQTSCSSQSRGQKEVRKEPEVRASSPTVGNRPSSHFWEKLERSPPSLLGPQLFSTHVVSPQRTYREDTRHRHMHTDPSHTSRPESLPVWHRSRVLGPLLSPANFTPRGLTP